MPSSEDFMPRLPEGIPPQRTGCPVSESSCSDVQVIHAGKGLRSGTSAFASGRSIPWPHFADAHGKELSCLQEPFALRGFDRSIRFVWNTAGIGHPAFADIESPCRRTANRYAVREAIPVGHIRQPPLPRQVKPEISGLPGNESPEYTP